MGKKSKRIKKPQFSGVPTIPSQDGKVNAKTKIKAKAPTINNFTFRTMYPWLGSAKVNEFTNYHQNSKFFSDNVADVICSLIPGIYKYANEIFIKQNAWNTPFKHSHLIAENKISLIRKIVSKIDKIELEDVELDNSLWQVGSANGARVIGYYSSAENSFYPLFVDWHHLIHPDVKYNSADYANFVYTPSYKVTKY